MLRAHLLGQGCQYVKFCLKNILFVKIVKCRTKKKLILFSLNQDSKRRRKIVQVEVNSVSECLDIGTHNACASGKIWCLWSEKIWRETLREPCYTIKIQKRNSDAVKTAQSTRYLNFFSKKIFPFLLLAEFTYHLTRP